MNIEYQLTDWSYSGKSESDTNAYNRFSEIISKNFDVEEIFLQGSYGNSTGVFASSDIDIVAVCRGYYMVSYDWKTDLKRLKYDLYDAIEGSYNFHFELGKKTIIYPGSPKYSSADILPCIRYKSRNGEDGIVFYDHSRKRYVVNYPKQHRDNGIDKNKRTSGSFKRAVRMFKGLRDHLVDEGKLGENVAPSYFLECLLYNVPDECFSEYMLDCFDNVLGWLIVNQNIIGEMKCQNEIHDLFNTFNGWNLMDCYKFMKAIHRWSEYA